MIWSRPLVSDEMATWVLENFRILICDSNLYEQFSRSELVLPTQQFFTAKSGKDHTTAISVFSDVCRILCLEDRNIILDRLPGNIEGVDHHSYQQISEIAGTFQNSDSQMVISYRPETMLSPIGFISTLAHELAHVIISAHTDEQGNIENELQTDLLCIILGFGGIQAQAARDIGWSGYLSNETRMFALAVFLRLRGINPSVASGMLDGNLRKKLARAVKLLCKFENEVMQLAQDIAPK